MDKWINILLLCFFKAEMRMSPESDNISYKINRKTYLLCKAGNRGKRGGKQKWRQGLRTEESMFWPKFIKIRETPWRTEVRINQPEKNLHWRQTLMCTLKLRWDRTLEKCNIQLSIEWSMRMRKLLRPRKNKHTIRAGGNSAQHPHKATSSAYSQQPDWKNLMIHRALS